MLIENTLFGIENKVNKAIEILKYFEPPEGYYVAFSGGKDSIVIKDLCKQSGVKYETHYQNTTIDPPELTAFIRKYHSDVIQHYPPRPYFKELVRQGFPMRQTRWCCEFLKERGGENRVVITGVRAQESAHRKKRRTFEYCNKKYVGKKFLNIILDWTLLEVWEYIKQNGLPYCELYDKGWKRIGCLACPCAPYKRRKDDMVQYPRVDKAYKKAFCELYELRGHLPPFKRWKSGEEMYHWWLTNESPDEDDGLFT